MCGIVGYIGHRDVSQVILEGLARLEYRGYDSAGMAVVGKDGVQVVREVGKVADLLQAVNRSPLKGTVGLGHTRWATHGGVTVENAHPHRDEGNSVVLVHNGIAENYLDIRDELLREGVTFVSETDTEVIAQLLARLYRGDPKQALVELSERLSGAFALAVIFTDDREHLYCLRKGSPLIVAFGDGEFLCASDVPAVLPYTRRIVYMGEGEMACLSREGVVFWDEKGRDISKESLQVDWDLSMVDKGGYPHFMLKEINEQGAVLRRSLQRRTEGDRVDLSHELDWTPKWARSLRRLHLVACGSSLYAAQVAERLIERFTDLDVRVEIASEYRYRAIPAGEETLAVLVSQSGETIDTLSAERFVKSKGARCLAVTNNGLSSIAREVDDVLLLEAGPEIGVAATKTFLGQVTVLYLLGLYLAKLRGTLPEADEGRIVRELVSLPYKVEASLEQAAVIQEIASRYADVKDFLFLGRGVSFPVALEGALKLKEISYIHAEAYAAGEMKHGPIALLEASVPVVVIMPDDSLFEKTLSNVQETKARHAPVIAVASRGRDVLLDQVQDVIWVPQTEPELSPFLTVVPLQLFAYYVALARGREIDQPRNLAKSVTVE
ncbi:MAG: glutamine--fructose-6-phosphate transaminase (isomerizing) [Dethiosulfovibrio peptidovorans]|nr:MAG: glutamine--fructose-6-phosphate transaminase (isomerizing) [Dethiosulfovibrio peptidovorans]